MVAVEVENLVVQMLMELQVDQAVVEVLLVAVDQVDLLDKEDLLVQVVELVDVEVVGLQSAQRGFELPTGACAVAAAGLAGEDQLVAPALEGLADEMAELLWLSEVRTIAADELWLSPSYRTPTIGIHFSWHNDWEGLQGVLPVVEEALAPLQVRPHWGKVFTLKQEQVASQYPRLDEFKGLLRDFDPDGKFRNPYLERYLYYGCDGRE